MKKDNIFIRIKHFLKNVFNNKKAITDGSEKKVVQIVGQNNANVPNINNENFSKDMEKLKRDELFKSYMNGTLKEEDLTEEEAEILENAIDDEIRKSEDTKLVVMLKKIAKDEEIVDLFRKYNAKQINEENLSEEQALKLELIYDIELERTRKNISFLNKKIVKN